VIGLASGTVFQQLPELFRCRVRGSKAASSRESPEIKMEKARERSRNNKIVPLKRQMRERNMFLDIFVSHCDLGEIIFRCVLQNFEEHRLTLDIKYLDNRVGKENETRRNDNKNDRDYAKLSTLIILTALMSARSIDTVIAPAMANKHVVRTPASRERMKMCHYGQKMSDISQGAK